MDTSYEGETAATLPALFQLFGQRFVIDSFVLSRVVADSVKGDRDMPSGLDVMAALGADEAVRLLRPELEKHGYAASLLAARTLFDERPPAARTATAYDAWLDALAQLSRPPAAGAVPQVMRTPAWRRKALQTQLASWSELRHDTILYVKQSYSGHIICDYPAGYVEPYPEAFARVAVLAEELGRRLGKLGAASEHVKTFLGTFAARARDLQRLAEKELAGKPFTADERKFVKDAIHVKTTSYGCGPPSKTYSGWYPTLIYSGVPDSWEPTIADVHTSAEHGVLEVGVGNVDFLVVAVDNGRDRAAYVGPVYSYYEFASGSRLTDQEWRESVSTARTPARPEWTGAFQGAAKRRSILPPAEDRETTKKPIPPAGEPGTLDLPLFYDGMKAISPKLYACMAEDHATAGLVVDLEITMSGRVRSARISQGAASPAGQQVRDGGLPSRALRAVRARPQDLVPDHEHRAVMERLPSPDERAHLLDALE